MDVTLSCDRCGCHAALYRLIGTDGALCAGCFVTEHVPPRYPGGCLQELRLSIGRGPRSLRAHRTAR